MLHIYLYHIDYKHQSSIYFNDISTISPLLHLGWTFGLLFALLFWEDVASIWLLNGYLSIYLSTCLPTYLSIHLSICLSLSLYIYIYRYSHDWGDIHVASRRQPPAPHRWAAARNCQ